MKEEHNILVIANRSEECEEIREMLAPALFKVEEKLLVQGSSLDWDRPDIDVFIVILAHDFEVPLGPTGGVVTTPNRSVLYVTSSHKDLAKQWAFQQGASDFIVRPFSPVELQFRVERMLASCTVRFEALASEEQLLAFLKTMVEEQVQVIEPVLDPLMPSGHFYPCVAQAIGRTPLDSMFLERLASEGLLTQRVVNRMRICSVCGDARLNYREVCPKCSSINAMREEMIHHFACAHIGTVASFKQGAELVCPKCSVVLRHIGLDYEKPAAQSVCHDCDYIFAGAKIETQCLHCAHVCAPEETLERPLYRYELTPMAHQAVSEGQLAGLNLASLLRSNQTGLYSRPYFEHELDRERTRYLRYKTPFCVLLIRIEEFDKVRANHPGEAGEYAGSVFKALSVGLRNLDTTCVWDADLLAVLLAETPGDGAQVVAARMKENVDALEHLRSIHEPKLAISLTVATQDFESCEAMMAAALRDLTE